MLIERLLKLRVSVYGVLFDEAVTKKSDRVSLDLKDSTWKVLEDLPPVLEPLAEATQLLTSETVPTCSSVYLILGKLVARLDSSEADSVAIGDVKSIIRASIIRRYDLNDIGQPTDPTELRGMMGLSALFDPRSKSLRFLAQPLREVIQDEAILLMDEIEVPVPAQVGELPNGDHPRNV